MDCEKAANRIADAVERRERVAIFGDYDVDGASSSALMSRFLHHFGIQDHIYIPDRIFEVTDLIPQRFASLLPKAQI